MRRRGVTWTTDQRGIAAVEFALVAPFLLILLGGAADFGLLVAGKSKLANGVAQGIQYALSTGPSVTVANLRAAVQSGAARSGVTEAVTVSVTAPACYCVSGSPAVLAASTPLSAANTCTGTCPTGAMPPGAYVQVAATYIYQPLMPFYSGLASTTVSEAVTARLR